MSTQTAWSGHVCLLWLFSFKKKNLLGGYPAETALQTPSDHLSPQSLSPSPLNECGPSPSHSTALFGRPILPLLHIPYLTQVLGSSNVPAPGTPWTLHICSFSLEPSGLFSLLLGYVCSLFSFQFKHHEVAFLYLLKMTSHHGKQDCDSSKTNSIGSAVQLPSTSPEELNFEETFAQLYS